MVTSIQEDAAYDRDKGEEKEDEEEHWFGPLQTWQFGSMPFIFCPEMGSAMQSGMQKLRSQLQRRDPSSAVCQERRLDNAKETPAGVAVGGYF